MKILFYLDIEWLSPLAAFSIWMKHSCESELDFDKLFSVIPEHLDTCHWTLLHPPDDGDTLDHTHRTGASHPG